MATALIKLHLSPTPCGNAKLLSCLTRGVYEVGGSPRRCDATATTISRYSRAASIILLWLRRGFIVHIKAASW